MGGGGGGLSRSLGPIPFHRLKGGECPVKGGNGPPRHGVLLDPFVNRILISYCAGERGKVGWGSEDSYELRD